MTKSYERFRDRVREITARNRGRSFDDVIDELRKYILGWRNYFAVAKVYGFTRLDEWVRRRLRCLKLKQSRASTHHGVWALSIAGNTKLPNAYFDKLGLPRLSDADLNDTNRRMRTRLSGGVGGDRPQP